MNWGGGGTSGIFGNAGGKSRGRGPEKQGGFQQVGDTGIPKI